MQARFCSTMVSAIFLSCSVIPASVSRTKTAISQRAMDSSARLTLKNSMESSTLRVFRMPAVSINTYCWRSPSVSTVNGTSTASRVVPGIGLTTTRSERVKALMIEDFPTLGRPTIASFRGCGWSRGEPDRARSGSRDSGSRLTAVSIKASMPSP